MSTLEDMFGADDAAWMSHPDRNCATGHPDQWFPIRTLTDKQAKSLCAGCPVINVCGAHALNHPQEQGVWGGLTEDARKKLRNQDAA